ncbi:SipW-dependent-type signal peptide-containing protein [Natrinema longum]|uniref:SipW-cognate class signal peptide n=1 Tax=Natrinema longum TaxID=370324 RepID=A0A8A2UCK5_9EURY|nr:SipW-dependent-type signal peptide-containing protein [Natrinema longum]MBZ6495701.1 SipW-dependent-type signal peptide-containing protein [Natrinema longum]QSW86340.1 hypothetical protein J0X27_05845 [Natrinema longum]
MTDENSISRRNVLAGLGTVGIGGALAGAGTSAFFSDGETLEGNELTAGELDLKLDWQQRYYGPSEEWEFVNAHPDHDEDGEQSIEVDGTVYRYSDLGRNIGDDEIDYCSDLDEDYHFGTEQDSLIALDDIKPGDCGEITFSYHLCDNPGWLWLRTMDVSTSILARKIDATLWYDLDGDNELDEEDPVIVEGSLEDILDELDDGVLLDGDPFEKSVPTEADECVVLEPKLDGDNLDEYTSPERNDPEELQKKDVITFPDTGIEITLTDVKRNADGETYGFSWESNTGICEISVGGGGDTKSREYDCATTGTDVIAPENSGGKQAAISNLTFSYCPEKDDDPVCVPNSTTQYLGFEWCLPETVGNEVQGESVGFDLQFYTEQCRHNDDPESPWADL